MVGAIEALVHVNASEMLLEVIGLGQRVTAAVTDTLGSPVARRMSR